MVDDTPEQTEVNQVLDRAEPLVRELQEWAATQPTDPPDTSDHRPSLTSGYARTL